LGSNSHVGLEGIWFDDCGSRMIGWLVKVKA
jgi:hypothetical protein